MRISSLKQKEENKQSRGSEGVGIDDDDVKLENNKYSKLQSQALKSLKKAAVAIFPLPRPNTAKRVSSFGYTVVSRRSVSQRRRVAIVSRGFTSLP